MFVQIDGLKDFEDRNYWSEAVQLLHNKWIIQKNNLNLLLRVATECWFIMANWDCCIEEQKWSYDDFKKILCEAYLYGEKEFSGNAKFLVFFGYMISLFPHCFFEKNSDEMFIIWEMKGKNMLKAAYELDSKNILYKVLYLGSTDKTMRFEKAKKELEPQLQTIFPGNTAIECYFKDVLA